MKFGNYAVQGELGRGGMGVVYEATRLGDGRPVALKLVRAGASRESLDRFHRERRLLGLLGEDDGFVPILDSGESPAGPFFVMPLLEGGTLRSRLANGPLAIDAAVSFGGALAGAISRAHEKGIVHRDLKPENVLFTRDGRPLVADLGLAKHFRADAPGASQSVRLTQDGAFKGTVAYVAPEQVENAATAGPPADVFALGAILYECLAGEPPFRGESIHEIIAQLLHGQATPLRERRPDVPGWLASIVDRCLARDPARRFADAGELARALEEPAAEPRSSRAFTTVALLALAAVTAALVVRRAPTAPPEDVTESSAATTSAARTTVASPRTDPERLRAAIATADSRLLATASAARGLGDGTTTYRDVERRLRASLAAVQALADLDPAARPSPRALAEIVRGYHALLPAVGFDVTLRQSEPARVREVVHAGIWAHALLLALGDPAVVEPPFALAAKLGFGSDFVPARNASLVEKLVPVLITAGPFLSGPAATDEELAAAGPALDALDRMDSLLAPLETSDPRARFLRGYVLAQKLRVASRGISPRRRARLTPEDLPEADELARDASSRVGELWLLSYGRGLARALAGKPDLAGRELRLEAYRHFVAAETTITTLLAQERAAPEDEREQLAAEHVASGRRPFTSNEVLSEIATWAAEAAFSEGQLDERSRPPSSRARPLDSPTAASRGSARRSCASSVASCCRRRPRT